MSDEISQRHKQVARLLVSGHSQTEIARLLSLHKSSISRIVREPQVLREMSRLNEIADTKTGTSVPGIDESIQDGAAKGLSELLKILDDQRTSPEVLKLKANIALELLGRAGYGEVKQLKVQQATVSAHFTSEDIKQIKTRAEKCLDQK